MRRAWCQLHNTRQEMTKASKSKRPPKGYEHALSCVCRRPLYIRTGFWFDAKCVAGPRGTFNACCEVAVLCLLKELSQQLYK